LSGKRERFAVFLQRLADDFFELGRHVRIEARRRRRRTAQTPLPKRGGAARGFKAFEA
jgi:hypothetical protein